jgi:phosphoribosylamine--glycine ligase
MNVLIVGGGGREHALAWKLSRSPRVARLYAAPGSAAMAALAECATLEGHEAIAAFAKARGIGLVVVGPEAPLVEGLADVLRARRLRVFGPSRAAAQLEGSKAFAKAFMDRHGIPTAAHRAFTRLPEAIEYVDSFEARFVVKASGLAAGKGVTVCESREQGRAALRRIMEERIFGAAGAEVVIESFLAGEEASFFALTDGQDFVTLPTCQDHKPVGELDRGPNTGGMGAYAPAPIVTAEVEQRVIERIVRPTLRGMAAEGHPFRGVLYVGLMVERGQPRVVEYNCRFGDPECEVQMLLLSSDLLDLLEAAADGSVAGIQPVWHAGAAACVVMAAPGYPDAPRKGLPIQGLDSLPDSELRVAFHSGTAKHGAQWITHGGRVLTVAARGGDLRQALRRAYAGVARVGWEGAIVRRDIGLKGLLRDRGGRPDVSVAILAGDATTAALVATAAATGLLEKFGLGAVQAQGLEGRERAAWLREQEALGVEVLIVLEGGGAGLAGQTSLPVIALQGAPFPGAAGVASPEQAAWLAARILALKYPDVQARLQTAQLEMTGTPGESRVSESAATTFPPR